MVFTQTKVYRDSSVSVTTRYALDGSGIESRWGAKFSAPVQAGPGSHPASSTMLTGSPGGVERPRRWPPTLPDAEVKERVELYPCCYSSGTLWPVIG